MASKYSLNSDTRGVEQIILQFTAGTSGAVPTKFTRAKEIYSVTKSTNDYVVKLTRGRTALIDWSVKVIQATPSVSGAWEGKVTVDDVAGTTKSVTLSFYGADGTAHALAAGDIMRMVLWVKNSAGAI